MLLNSYGHAVIAGTPARETRRGQEIALIAEIAILQIDVTNVESDPPFGVHVSKRATKLRDLGAPCRSRRLTPLRCGESLRLDWHGKVACSVVQCSLPPNKVCIAGLNKVTLLCSHEMPLTYHRNLNTYIRHGDTGFNT